ncbi:protein DA1-related 1-like [Cynara cardunculus var. scolymus]|uniref:protein DA1-related 1-like n=1 Tax=Cynara cardunculus var. scolymus TaxID=59895 RepID=UPI000D62C592|nr:protein DA1-related 1-like [Cynara cardunculus var. scolymus]
MDWLSRIFESTTREASERRYNGRYGENTSSIRTYPPTSWASQPEIEDIDRAIAVSLAEEGKGKHMINDDSQLKEDEYLARALQESLKVGPPPRNRNVNQNGNVRQPMSFPYSTGFRICAGCNSAIGHGPILSCMGAVWHPKCLRCHACNLPIAEYEFSMSGNYAYHKSCYKERRHPRCDVCQHFIRTNAAGFIEYKTHPFWAQKYCPFHESDGTPRCCSCERMEPRETRYAALNDGRKLCLECLDSAVMDTTECQPLYFDIQQFYEGLDMKLEQKVPLLLVERQALNEAMNGERSGHYHMPETRGLCLSEEQTVSTVLRQPRIGIGNRIPNMRIEPYKLTGHCEVTAILILYGLPRLLTGSILAHEMMHAWLRLKGYRTLRQDVEEGICQVLAHMWLTSQIASISSRQGKRSPSEKKLAEFFKHQIESDQSQVYGNGFRAGNQAVLKYGLQKTLYHIRLTGNFPF